MREVTRAQRARLGLFLLISGSILVVILAVVTGAKIFEKRDAYFVRYRDVSVSGLEIGAQVKYHGVRVGRVENVYIDPEAVETIVVELSMDHGTPLKDDVKAVINSLSLTGIKIIELTGGSSEALQLEVGSEIPAGESSFQLITGKAEAVSEKLEIVLSNLIAMTSHENQNKLMGLIDNTSLILEDVHGIMSDNRSNLQQTFANVEVASENLLELSSSDAIRRAFANIDSAAYDIQAAEFGKAVTDLRETLIQAKTTFTHIDLTLLKGRHDILTSLEVLRESLDSFNDFARLISEDPSLLLRGTKVGEVRGVTK
ncbi:MlaD family protein [Calditrichota bacterium]